MLSGNDIINSIYSGKLLLSLVSIVVRQTWHFDFFSDGKLLIMPEN